MATVDTAPAERRTPPAPREPSSSTALPAQPRSSSPAAQSRAAVPEQQSQTLIGSVQRAMRLLESVARHERGTPAKQLARETGMALPTAYHLLRTLVHEGYLYRDRGLFFLGEAAERLSSSGAAQKRRSAVAEAMARWRDAIGAPMYYAMYRDGEIEIMCVSASAAYPAAEEWADFRATGHAHAIGRCLLSQLDDDARRDHLARHPVLSLTPYTVRDEHSLLRRLERTPRMEPVTERQEYALGTVCAAIPITVGTTVATMGFSLPVHQADRLLPAARQLQREVGRCLGSLALSISI
ncbi:IclR family transcriptional regulator C-terminal domain-containing protein [Streptomyces thermoalcalitolerans]|uniref:IclR family transcriptional regulator C-terminal domain-containing protein n=1 Tax=Streptomyces thermoalcalitolerans TaxID=65605 RepID=A0ABN1NCN5_9ACTN